MIKNDELQKEINVVLEALSAEIVINPNGNS